MAGSATEVLENAEQTLKREVFWRLIASMYIGNAMLLIYLLRKLRFPEAPIILGFVLGPMLEDQMRRALTLSLGDFSVFLTRIVSAALVLLTAAYWLLPALKRFWARRTSRP
ncbi:MAG: hypothetical protein HY725_05645 [Candidatus Rokubacteria bacterium]|nr:hypothetical protein [Candidatus Rokubacteria bacterium]